MQHQMPTWQQVGIPALLVNNIKQMKPTFLLDQLVHQLVFHSMKKLILTYSCDQCGECYTPNRSTEEVGQCNECGSKKVRCIQSIKYNRDQKVPLYSRGGPQFQSIPNQMWENFPIYFRLRPDNSMDWEWHDNLYHVAFAGGETASAQTPRLAICKAAVLTPYLWDAYYDWKTAQRRDTIDQKFISQIFNQFSPPPRREL